MGITPQKWLKQADYDIDKNTVLNILSRFRLVLETQGLKVNRLVLFGSYADGTYKEGSDINVVVISEGFEGKDYWERLDILSNAINEIFEPIEAVAMTQEEWERGESVVCEYAREGAILVT